MHKTPNRSIAATQYGIGRNKLRHWQTYSGGLPAIRAGERAEQQIKEKDDERDAKHEHLCEHLDRLDRRLAAPGSGAAAAGRHERKGASGHWYHVLGSPLRSRQAILEAVSGGGDSSRSA
jgi:hypothetical protein